MVEQPMRQQRVTGTPGNTAADVPSSAWSPFRHTAFTVLWIATVVANVGSWMYTKVEQPTSIPVYKRRGLRFSVLRPILLSVAVQRWEAFTGDVVHLEADVRTFAWSLAERRPASGSLPK
jgi:hypothetical protein